MHSFPLFSSHFNGVHTSPVAPWGGRNKRKGNLLRSWMSEHTFILYPYLIGSLLVMYRISVWNKFSFEVWQTCSDVFWVSLWPLRNWMIYWFLILSKWSLFFFLSGSLGLSFWPQRSAVSQWQATGWVRLYPLCLALSGTYSIWKLLTFGLEKFSLIVLLVITLSLIAVLFLFFF